eukprot:359289-Chlamydomonas_euryale.AAC.2
MATEAVMQQMEGGSHHGDRAGDATDGGTFTPGAQWHAMKRFRAWQRQTKVQTGHLAPNLVSSTPHTGQL